MCGITGWIDFANDLRPNRDILQAMTRTMSARGPDDEGVWMSPHGCLGNRRLAVIDPANGAQPMAVGQTALTYAGEVYNYRELRRELEAAGQVFTTNCDTEVVLRAYLQWGADMVDRLIGVYAFAIWDGDKEEALLVRDRLGIKPLYYHLLPDGMLFASEPKALLANPRVKRVLDPVGFRNALVLLPSAEGRTSFQDISEVMPGHCVHVTRAGIRDRTYWALEARPHEDDYETTVDKVRSLLEDIVEHEIVSDVPWGALLSGGIDSSVIAALAQRSAGGSLRTFAVDFGGDAADFQPDELRDSSDTPFAEEVARYIGSEHHNILVETETLWNPAFRKAILRARDLPNHLGDLDGSLYLLCGGVRKKSIMAISGEAADEIFGGYPWLFDDAAVQAPFFPWMVYQMNRGTHPPFGLFDPKLLDRLKLWEFLGEAYDHALAEVPRLDGEEGQQARMREASYLDITRFMRGMLDRMDRTAYANSLEVRVPFCDYRLVEYVFNVPWSMKSRDGRNKALLRDASKGLVPESVNERPKSAFPSPQDIRYDQMLLTELRRIVDGDDEPLRPFVDVEAIRGVLTEGDDAMSGSWTVRLRAEGVARANAWLKEYDVDPSALEEPEPVG
jgi:asparagine synthase (glutamine-hydrolysing)